MQPAATLTLTLALTLTLTQILQWLFMAVADHPVLTALCDQVARQVYLSTCVHPIRMLQVVRTCPFVDPSITPNPAGERTVSRRAHNAGHTGAHWARAVLRRRDDAQRQRGDAGYSYAWWAEGGGRTQWR
jgi:hypothetical protein